MAQPKKGTRQGTLPPAGEEEHRLRDRPHQDELQQHDRDDHGHRRGVVCWESAGSAGFKGSRKSTPFAAQVTADSAARKGMEHGLERVEVHAKGAGSGRDTAIRSLQAAGLQVTTVKDVTPQAHNGCRPRKRRRV